MALIELLLFLIGSHLQKMSCEKDTTWRSDIKTHDSGSDQRHAVKGLFDNMTKNRIAEKNVLKQILHRAIASSYRGTLSKLVTILKSCNINAW